MADTSPSSKPSIPRANVLGVGVSAINLDSAITAIDQALQTRTKGYVCVTGVHGISEAQSDASFRSILNSSFLTTPDGMPTVWLGRWQGFSNMDRVYGPDLLLRVCELSARRHYSHFFFGGANGVAAELAARLAGRFPGLEIAGTYEPPFRPLNAQEETELLRNVEAQAPDVFWVGLSTPKQERFMAEYWRKLNATLLFGVGAAFDFHAGRIRQAPRWMQRSGLEWLFRLGCEPRRLWKRYLKNNPLFLTRAACQITGVRRYKLD